MKFDSRKNEDISLNGFYLNIGYEFADKYLGGDVSLRKFLFEVKSIFPFFENHLLTVPRVQYERVFGKYVPFYEQATLGGSDLFRGFGEGRWYDRVKLLFSLEERFIICKTKIFNVNVEWEISPFIEYGGVFPRTREIKQHNFVFVAGTGFRAIIRPNIVGRVDIGKGPEGIKVFVNLGYPY